MDSLPPELILEIPHHLPLPSLASLVLVSRRLHTILNPTLYRRDASSGKPTAPFWAAERGILSTLVQSHAAGANLSETRLFGKPRGHMTDPYRSFHFKNETPVAAGNSRIGNAGRNLAGRTRRFSIGSSSFLDGPSGRYAPTYWWRPVDLAAHHGHTDLVRFLVTAGGVSVVKEGSKGLCDEGCPGGQDQRPGLRFEWVIHSTLQAARCQGHVETADLIEEYGQREVSLRRGDGKGGCAAVDAVGMMEKIGDEGAGFSFRDFVLERF
ncbi:hypothetical protein OQA88_8384 [Cercophora sp. LCS_1]